MKLLKLFLFQANALFPFLYPSLQPFYKFYFFKGIYKFIKDYYLYKRLANKDVNFPISLLQTYPRYYDSFESAGEIPRHYFIQDIWAAQKVYKSRTSIHYDIGSRINGFIAHCVVFCKVIMLDIRPLNLSLPNLSFKQTDASKMSNISSRSISSISSLHAVEHFGLGRYGDPIDPKGYLKVINEILRIVSKGGDIYFSVPIGRQRLEFNAHRVFDPCYVETLFKGCDLIEFSVIDDSDQFVKNADLNEYRNSGYSCGLFHFRKI